MITFTTKNLIWSLTILIIIGIIGFLSYSFLTTTGSTSSLAIQYPNKNNITIGWIGPLTGKTEWLGVDGLKAIQLGIEQYNKSKKSTEPSITLLFANSPLESSTVNQAYHNMVKKHVKLIFVLSSDDTKELADQALRDGVIIINPLNNDRTLANLNPNIFLIAKTTESLSSIMADRMLAQGKHRALVVYSTSEDFTKTMAKNFADVFTVSGGQAIMRPYSALTMTDFRPILAEGKANHVDVYLFIGASEMGTAMKQARDMGIKENFYSTDFITNPTTIANAKDAIEGVQFPDFTYLDGNLLLAKKFLKQFEEKYQTKPLIQWSALQAYDALHIAIWAINQAITKPGNFADNMKIALLSVRNHEGVSGNITIRPDGTSEGIYPGMYIFKNGKSERLITSQG